MTPLMSPPLSHSTHCARVVLIINTTSAGRGLLAVIDSLLPHLVGIPLPSPLLCVLSPLQLSCDLSYFALYLQVLG